MVKEFFARRLSAVLVAFVLLAQFVPVSLAGQPFMIDGYVTDSSTGNALGGVSITAEFTSASSRASDGFYVSSGDFSVTDGTTYHVTASKTGYRSQTATFTYHLGDGGFDHNFALEPLPQATVGFQSSSQTVNEGDSVTINVVRGGDTSNTISVFVGASSLPDGVTTTCPSALSWGAGETGAKSFTMTVPHDSVAQGDSRSVTFTLSSVSGGVISQATDTVTIHDTNVASGIQFQSASGSASEGGSATATITRSGDTPGSFDVTFSTSTSVAGHTVTVPGSVHFDAGDTSKPVVISVPTNSIVEGTWTATVTLVAPSGVTLGSQSSFTLSISDMNGPSTVQFSSASATVNEGATQQVTVTRIGDVPASFDVTLTATPSSNGHAVTGVPSSIHFNAGESSKPFTITVPANSQVEGAWSTTITMSAPSGVSLGSQSSFTLNVNDMNAASTVQFSTSSGLANEGATQPITVSRTGDAPATFDVTLAVTPSSNGHAVSGVPSSLHFNVGETYRQFTISVPANDQVEGDWYTTVTLTAPAGVTLGSQNTFKLNVHDVNKVPTIAFSSANSNVDEGHSVTITATRSSDDLSRASSATVTATGDSGYTTTPALPITLNWAIGATTASFTVNVASDSVAQGNRHVTFTMAAGTNANIGSQATNALTIHDANAPATIGFTVASSSITTNGGDVTITVHRYGASGAAASAVVSASGSATAGTDYTTSQTMPWTVNFASGETEKTMTVHVNSVSGSKNIVFTLGTLTGAAAADNQQYTLSIQPPAASSSGTATFQFDQAAGSASTGQVTLNVIRSGSTSASNTVQVWVNGASTAIADTDYTASQMMPATLSFGPGETLRSVIFNVVGNHSGMAAKKLVLTLESASDGATIGAGNVCTLTIGGSSTTGTGTSSGTNETSTGASFGSGLVRNLHTNVTYDRIQWGIDNATAGDTLIVSAGTFNEHIVVNKALTIRAETGSKPVIDGQGAGRVVDISASSVVLDSFVVRGSAAGGYGIYGQGNGITVRNCQVTGNGYGIFFDDVSGCAIESCDVGQNSYGITFDDTTNSHITGCTVSSNANYGISLREASNSNQVESNTVTNNGGAGIEVTESDHNVIIYNNLENNGAYGVTMHCQFNQVYLNTFKANSPANALYDPGNEPDNNLWHSDGAVKYRYNGVEYNGIVGNFWDTFSGPDANKDGVSETQFTAGKIVDTNPLVVAGTEIKDVQKTTTSTESTSTSWTWLLLLAFIPLAGIVIYYFAFVREK